VDTRYCSSALIQSLRTRARFHFRSSLPRTSAAPAPFSFSPTNIFSSISSHLTSKLPLSINQLLHATVPSHNICTFTHTPRCKVTASVVSHAFFVSLLLCSFDLWRAPLLSTLGEQQFFPFWPPCPTLCLCTTLPSSHPHTFFRKFRTYKHIHTQSSHLLLPTHTPGFTISSKCQTKRKIRSRTAVACA